jgi:hypothetical protein
MKPIVMTVLVVAGQASVNAGITAAMPKQPTRLTMRVPYIASVISSDIVRGKKSENSRKQTQTGEGLNLTWQSPSMW